MAIKGLDKLTKKLSGAGDAFKGLDAEIAGISFEPTDEASVQSAVAQMEKAIDARIRKYPGNAIVSTTGTAMKAQYRQMILDQVPKR